MMSEQQTVIRQQIILRSLIIWLGIILAEIVHGIVRAVAVVPQVGKFRADQLGVFSGSLIILVIAYFTIEWIGARRTGELLAVGVVWTVLAFVFEMLFGYFVVGLAWEELFASYNLFRGGLMPLGLLFMLVSPLVAKSLRNIR